MPSLPYLNRVEPAIAVEGEADDVRGVLVPAGVDRVAHDVSRLGEDLLDQDLLPAQGDPLAQVGRDAHHQAVAGLRQPPLLPLLLPALQLLDHGRQLVVARLLVQQVEVLQGGEQRGELAYAAAQRVRGHRTTEESDRAGKPSE